MYHVFFMRSAADGRLGCLCLLPVMSGATINMGRCLWQTDFTFCGCSLSSRIVRSYGYSDSGFWRTTMQVFTVVYWFIFPPTVLGGFLFSHQHLLSFVFLISGESNWSEEIPHCGFKKCLFRSSAHFSVRVIWRGGCFFFLSSLT